MNEAQGSETRQLLAALAELVAARGPGRGIELGWERRGGFRKACRSYILGGAALELLRDAVVLAELRRLGAPTWPNVLQVQALDNERCVRLWREANGLDTEEKFAAALPDLFHPYDVRRDKRTRLPGPGEPLASWESFPGSPAALESPTVRATLEKLWQAAVLGESWPIPILRRFAKAWAFGDRQAERVVNVRRAERDEALLKERASLAGFLEGVWSEIKHARPSEKTIREALQRGRIRGWMLSYDPRSGASVLRIGGSDVDVAALIVEALANRGWRGPIPWVRTATKALEQFYDRQVSPKAPVDRAAKRRRKTARPTR
jgi:hypothetical protein